MSALFGKLCRTCLGTPENLYPFDLRCALPQKEPQTDGGPSRQMIRNLLLIVAHSTIELDAELPEQICGDCLNELVRAKQFLEKCEKSEAALKNMLITSRNTSRKDNNLTEYRILQSHKEEVFIERIDHPVDGPSETIYSVREKELSETINQSPSKQLDLIAQEARKTRSSAKTGKNKIETAPKILKGSATILPDRNEDSAVFINLSKEVSPLLGEHVIIEDCAELREEDVHDEDDGDDMDDDNDDDEEYIVINRGEDDVKLLDSTGNNLERGTSCPDCGVIFIRAKSLHRHRIRYHSNNGEGDNSTVSATSKKRFKCNNCSVLFVYKKTLLKHQKLNNCSLKSPVKYSCCVCNREFVRVSALAVHLKIHPDSPQNDVKLVCGVCPEDKREEFQTISDLSRHIQVHAASTGHVCKDCGRCFKMYSSLKDHVRTHTGDRPFACTICEKTFSQATNLKQHMNRHEQKKDYKCTPPCMASFVSKGELVTHMRKHTGEQPFVCECGMKFTTSSSMVKHKRKHTGETPYRCSQCENSYGTLLALKKHMTDHSTTNNGVTLNKFSCGVCGLSFRYATALKTHKATHHTDTE